MSIFIAGSARVAALVAAVSLTALTTGALVSSMPAAAQPAFGAGGPGPRATNQNLPKTPTAVRLPTRMRSRGGTAIRSASGKGTPSSSRPPASTTPSGFQMEACRTPPSFI